MRDLPPDVFEVRLRHSAYDDRTSMEVWSRMYDIRLGFHIRAMWGDPRPLADWVEGFIGGTVRAWYGARIGAGAGREMAQALMPHWEREIHRQMERYEYEGRTRRHRNDMQDALMYGTNARYMYRDAWSEFFDGPAEDPKAKQKARELLIRNLDAGQEKSFKKSGEFRVTAKDGKVYTIKTARSFNVIGDDGAKYCGQLEDTPIEDQMLAQKLLLEHEPEKFFKNANVSPAPSAIPRPEDQMIRPPMWLQPGRNWT